MAPVTTTTFAERSDTALFAGFALTLGPGGDGAEAILGVAHGEIDLDGDVTGAKATLHFGILEGFEINKIKLTGLFGNDSVQAEVGGGYSFKNSSPFAVVGTNGEYFAAGSDIYFNGTFEGYLGVHTIGQISLDTMTTTTTAPVMSPVIVSPVAE
ncbi:hypothetical protein ACERZ8_06915 [Tateyamaria armeniaca]|uniref:Transferrin-binding protein B C-lobe/N-lobe beta barrel domain-containing protein n=1 Tax=Tateyamaria armeniaca TaxID=2518930 RepID=A0ABW8UU74_9RHOB